MAIKPPRYIAHFYPKRLPHRFTDVLIIGGGIAGLRAALEVDPRNSVLVVTKNAITQSSSQFAQGGIAGVFAPDDRFEDHAEDTIKAGGTLCDRETVDMVIKEAPDRIRELIEIGTKFDSTQAGLTLGREGGHGRHRIVHAMGDSTGKEIMRAVIENVRERENIAIQENAFTLDLLTSDSSSNDDRSNENRCIGALVSDEWGQKFFVWAKQTILCTGGSGQLFRESTNPPVATSDGHAIAFRAGVELSDMEFMQFHPTVLYIAGSSRSLITEAIRGEGAYLLDREGNRFMADYDERGELAPRDVVSQAIVRQMEKTQHSNVYLDLSHLDAGFVRKRFPGIHQTCLEFGIDITTDQVPVRPGAHYMIGGISVDDQGRTELPGLWAAGEVIRSGLHGANRLASNSLLEGLVYGAHAGQAASNAALEMADHFQAHPIENPQIEATSQMLDLGDIRNSLKSLMWRSVGVQRDAERLEEAAATVDMWQQYVLPLQFESTHGWELQNMLTIARVMISAALKREESRGVHFRTDFPQINDDQWRRHVCFRGDQIYLSPGQ